MIYTIELKYITSIREVVEAEDEGEAYELARIKAEEADPSDFNFIEELESCVLNVD